MQIARKIIALIYFFVVMMMCAKSVYASGVPKQIVISNASISIVLNYTDGVSIVSLIVNGQKVISKTDGMFTSVSMAGHLYSSLHVNKIPQLVKTGSSIKIMGIEYGDGTLTIKENWIFNITQQTIKWSIQRSFSNPVLIDESAVPVINFDSLQTFEGAYQGYGGLAWFYLFHEKPSTYGVHTQSTSFWNSKTGLGLQLSVHTSGKKVAMKYSRTAEDRIACAITVSDKDMVPLYDSGTNRRLFLSGRTDVWGAFTAHTGTQSITFSAFDFNERYGRGRFAGIDGNRVSAVLNTIARIGVIDSLHFGGNSWRTPFGPICLHEQYIAQMGLGINDPDYLKGYQSCLAFFLRHGVKKDGRVFSRWAYNNEDASPGQYNKDGFYEAQWGILMDANPDLVSNVAELYDLTGDKTWVKDQQAYCEKVLGWILKRDSNGNGLVEMINDNETQQKSSDWIDIIWASYENAFVNAKLYHALVKWANIEMQLNNYAKANEYTIFAAKLKASFNKPVKDGGFWDSDNHCYVHWLDKNKTAHGRNMVTPINFMAIAYGICDDSVRQKLILDTIETQMQQEKLFFWPLTMTSYAAGEGKESQYPFPSYENGDLFLSWGAVAIEAYAKYKPELAVKYVNNVINQYAKDGLAFQRYGRLKQDGLGDDILSGNSLSITGLYQAVYGINPLYNRFYLEPHITPELAGTELKYYFRGQRLTVNLDSNVYAVSNNRFKIISSNAFGYYATAGKLSYFNGNNANSSLEVSTISPLTITINKWGTEKKDWVQSGLNGSANIHYIVRQLKPNSEYLFAINGKIIKKIKSNTKGELAIDCISKTASENITLIKASSVIM